MWDRMQTISDLGVSKLIADWQARGKEIDQLREALRYGCGAEINELVARDLPAEWSPNSGIGKMLAALGCSSTTLDVAARAALEGKP